MSVFQLALISDVNALDDFNNNRITRILTADFPQYFAIISRVRQEVHAIGPEGGILSSTVVPQVQAIFPEGALTKKIKVGLQVGNDDDDDSRTAKRRRNLGLGLTKAWRKIFRSRTVNTTDKPIYNIQALESNVDQNEIEQIQLNTNETKGDNDSVKKHAVQNSNESKIEMWVVIKDNDKRRKSNDNDLVDKEIESLIADRAVQQLDSLSSKPIDEIDNFEQQSIRKDNFVHILNIRPATVRKEVLTPNNTSNNNNVQLNGKVSKNSNVSKNNNKKVKKINKTKKNKLVDDEIRSKRNHSSSSATASLVTILFPRVNLLSKMF